MTAGTVLVVDDDSALLRLLSVMLEAAGFQALVAPDAARALELLSQGSLDIGAAVVDYQLPGSSLHDLLDQIRSHPSHIRSIVTSGYSLELLEESEGLLPSGVEFLQKPFLPGELVAAVQRAFTKVSGIGN